jgi:hypothetical protein
MLAGMRLRVIGEMPLAATAIPGLGDVVGGAKLGANALKIRVW